MKTNIIHKDSKHFIYQLNDMLKLISKSTISYQQFYILCYEANIRPISDAQNTKFIKFFSNNQIPTTKILHIFTLVNVQIIHNTPIYYVKFGQSKLQHKLQQCFEEWKNIMKQKFGNQMRWFDGVAGQPSSRRIKSFTFKKRIKYILQDSQHQNCYQQICNKFPKNLKNQIQWSTFMAVIRQKNHQNIPSEQSTYKFRGKMNTSCVRYKNSSENFENYSIHPHQNGYKKNRAQSSLKSRTESINFSTTKPPQKQQSSHENYFIHNKFRSNCVKLKKTQRAKRINTEVIKIQNFD